MRGGGLLLQESFQRGWLDAIQLSPLYNNFTELANAQGGCERIKNTPMPEQYDYFPMLFVRLDVAAGVIVETILARFSSAAPWARQGTTSGSFNSAVSSDPNNGDADKLSIIRKVNEL